MRNKKSNNKVKKNGKFRQKCRIEKMKQRNGLGKKGLEFLKK
jgi:hypothetical protein